MFHLKSFYRYHIRGSIQYRKAAYQLKSDQIPVLIYTMAKVGSMSLYRSLKDQVGVPVFHIHTMQQKKIEEAYQLCRAKGWWPDSKNPGALIYHQKIKRKKSVKIITAVRDPIARNVSAFFEVFRFYTGQNATKYKGKTINLQEVFMEALPHQFPLTWLDDELKTSTGIDVYQQPFDPTKKYKIYHFQNIDLLLLRTDLEDQHKEKVVCEFLQLPDFKLQNYNVGSEKAYAKLYHNFKTQINLPEAYLTKMLESKYCQHFYSKEEIEGFYRLWNA